MLPPRPHKTSFSAGSLTPLSASGVTIIIDDAAPPAVLLLDAKEAPPSSESVVAVGDMIRSWGGIAGILW